MANINLTPGERYTFGKLKGVSVITDSTDNAETPKYIRNKLYVTASAAELNVAGVNASVIVSTTTVNDPMLQFSIGTLQAENWTMGIDNTDSGSFKINNGYTLGTTSTMALRIDTNENISIPGDVSITGSVIIPGSTIPIDTAWTSYTPQWTSGFSPFPVLNNGTATGAYKVIGKTCFVRGIIVMGTTTTYGTGAWLISLPITASLAQSILIPAVMANLPTGGWYSGLVNGGRIGNTSKAEIQWQTAAGTADPLSATVPFTWGSADVFSFNGSYEIA
jgi:hypothetical protein